MWDNRGNKRNESAPDFRCRSRACNGVIWPTRVVAAAPVAISRGTETVANAPLTTSGSLRRYLDITEFVLRHVRTLYGSAGLTCDPDQIVAIAETLFSAESAAKRNE